MPQLVQVSLDGEDPVADHMRRARRHLAPGGHPLDLHEALHQLRAVNNRPEHARHRGDELLVFLGEVVRHPGVFTAPAQNTQHAQHPLVPDNRRGDQPAHLVRRQFLVKTPPSRIGARIARPHRPALLRHPSRNPFARSVVRLPDVLAEFTQRCFQHEGGVVFVEQEDGAVLKADRFRHETDDLLQKRRRAREPADLASEGHERRLAFGLQVLVQAKGGEVRDYAQECLMLLAERVGLRTLDVDDALRAPVTVADRHRNLAHNIAEVADVVGVVVNVSRAVRFACHRHVAGDTPAGLLRHLQPEAGVRLVPAASRRVSDRELTMFVVHHCDKSPPGAHGLHGRQQDRIHDVVQVAVGRYQKAGYAVEDGKTFTSAGKLSQPRLPLSRESA